MYGDSVTAAIRRQPTRFHVVSVAVLLAAVFVASVVSAELRFPGSSTAPWWPAAGFSVIAVFAGRGRGLLVAALIVPVTAAANLLSGTVWWVALGFGVANAVEAWVVVAITGYRRNPGQRFRHPDAVRFILATAGGAGVIGVLVGAVVAADGGAFFDTAAHVAASHGSSVLLIGVLGIMPRASFVPRRPLELALQVVALALAIGVAFGSTSQLPLAFLPFPLLAWAAFRFSAALTLVQIALVSVAVTILSFLGRGSLAALTVGDPELLIGVIQIFTVSIAASLLPLAAAQDDRTELYLRLSAREQLLRGAIVNAHAGFIVARREDGGRLRVVESNPNGERMLASWLTTDGAGTFVNRARVAAVSLSGTGGAVSDVALADGVHLEVTATPVDGDSALLLIQAVDTTEQSKAARALADAFVHEREAADRLRALAVQKDEFVSSVSHELRTPVTSILGYAEDLAEADLPDSERRGVEIIMRNARRLAELVDDLLTMSREAGLPPADSTAVAVRSAISQCVEDLAAIAERARVGVEVAEGDDHTILGDRMALDRILVNLLANAIKFTPPGGRIDISLSASDDFARIEVADTGRGIPPGEIDRVFERFYRVTVEKEFVPGTGLGLPIVRDLVTRMGGRVELRSDGETGTTAIVELPLSETPLAAGAEAG